MHKNTIKNATLLVVRIFYKYKLKSTPLSTGAFVYGLFLFTLAKMSNNTYNGENNS